MTTTPALLAAALHRRERLTTLLAANLPPDEARTEIEAANRDLLAAAIADGDELVKQITALIDTSTRRQDAVTQPSPVVIATAGLPSVDVADDLATAVAESVATTPVSPRSRPTGRRSGASSQTAPIAPTAPDDWQIDEFVANGGF